MNFLGFLSQVSDINIKKESPVGHGNVICFSIYCGPDADFGNGKNCIWVDVLDTQSEIWLAFKDYFEDSTIRKVSVLESFSIIILN